MAYAKLGLLLCSASIALASNAHADESGEYMLKAAFLYNFAIFTSWPERSMDNFNLCIYGKDPFNRDFDSLMQKKNVNERKVIIHRINTTDRLDQCQLVFISRSAIGDLAGVINSIKDKPVLTVADSPGVSEQGVVLNMNVKDDKITFEANLNRARKAGLNLSSQLLRLATEVHQ
ncbi:YfiR family protein [Nitrosomonas sp. Is24]|uniref:YfiR family protein n=1 Tax=Nitrosomonas sp. Is24 TaxID=3080533 RepID=UPI00294AD8AA|nr:YfiR family protein [Nitrosomonas sp. Is24]MDV6342595.1 YfiR family protein [Nitrosomonas sp. Is24]